MTSALRPGGARTTTSRGLHALLLCALGAGVYANSLDVPFYLDDGRNLRDNPHIRIEQLDPHALLRAAFESPSPRPVAYLSFALNHYASGPGLAGYHAVNAAVHCANGVLVYLLLLWLLERRRGLPGQRTSALQRSSPGAMALLGAAIFVAHPIQTQAVTYLVQRMTSLAALFTLLALLLFLHGRLAPPGRRRALFFAGCFGSWLLALGAKQIAAALPLALWLCEWFFFRDLSRDWLRRGLRPALAAGGLLLALAVLYLGFDPWATLAERYDARDFTAAERLLTQPRVLFLYLGLIAWPFPGRLNLLHEIAPSRSLVEPASTLAALLGLVALLALAAALAPRYRIASFGILWFFVWQLVESTILPLEMVFEHRCYLPLVGVSLLASEALFALPERRRGLVGATGAGLVLLLAFAAHLRNEQWRDPVAFWADITARSPERIRPRNQLGLELVRQGRVEQGIRQLREALRRDPHQFAVHNNLASAYEASGDLASAVAAYREALRLEPDFAEGYYNLGRAHESGGDVEGALAAYRESLRLKPDLPQSAIRLALLHRQRGEHAESARVLERALAAAPAFPEAHNQLGMTLVLLGEIEPAISHFEAAVAQQPGFAEAHSNLGAALTRAGRLEKALPHLREALRLDPGNAEAHNNLGVLLARRGRLGQARHSFEEALRIDPGYEEARRNLERARQAEASAR